jgi:hypothetical protein
MFYHSVSNVSFLLNPFNPIHLLLQLNIKSTLSQYQTRFPSPAFFASPKSTVIENVRDQVSLITLSYIASTCVSSFTYILSLSFSSLISTTSNPSSAQRYNALDGYHISRTTSPIYNTTFTSSFSDVITAAVNPRSPPLTPSNLSPMPHNNKRQKPHCCHPSRISAHAPAHTQDHAP